MFQRGVCHTFNSGQQGYPKLYATTAGKIQALSLYLDAQPEEYYGPYSYDATGFKILVHDQSELYPNIEDLALDVTPGFTTNIRVRRSKVSTAERGCVMHACRKFSSCSFVIFAPCPSLFFLESLLFP